MYNGRKSLYAAFMCVIFLAVLCPAHAAIRNDPSPVRQIKKETPTPTPAPSFEDDKKNTDRTSKNDGKQKNNNRKPGSKKSGGKKGTTTERKHNPRNTPDNLPSRSRGHSRITDFRLAGSSPCAVLRRAGGDTITIPFVREGKGFRIDTVTGAIPSGTLLTVPAGYRVYCDVGHANIISGKGYRTTYNGHTMVQYDSGAEIVYAVNSGMVIISSEFADDPLKVNIAPVPMYNTDISDVVIAKNEPDYDNRSVVPEEVIDTYEISDDDKHRLIEMHNEASRRLSKEGRADSYREIFDIYDKDYLAAYGVALAEFDMYHGKQCIEWCDIALSINKRYLPAKRLKNKAEGII